MQILFAWNFDPKTSKKFFLKKESASTKTMILLMLLWVKSVTRLKNKYIICSRISEKKFREILWYFSSDIEAVKIAEFTTISEQTITKIIKNIRIFDA